VETTRENTGNVWLQLGSNFEDITRYNNGITSKALAQLEPKFWGVKPNIFIN